VKNILSEFTDELKLQLKEAIHKDDYARAAKLAEYLQMMLLEFGVEKGSAESDASPMRKTGRVGRPRKNKAADDKPPKVKRGRKAKKQFKPEDKPKKIQKGPYAVEVNDGGWVKVDEREE